MCDVMVHRGPDSFGEFTRPRGRARHAPARDRRRRRRQAAARQRGRHGPGRLQRRDLQLAASCRRSSIARGHRFRTRSDVEVIVAPLRGGGRRLSRGSSTACSPSRSGTRRSAASSSGATASASSRCTSRRSATACSSAPRRRRSSPAARAEARSAGAARLPDARLRPGPAPHLRGHDAAAARTRAGRRAERSGVTTERVLGAPWPRDADRAALRGRLAGRADAHAARGGREPSDVPTCRSASSSPAASIPATIVALMRELGVSPDPHVLGRLRGEELQRARHSRARSRSATAPSTTSWSCAPTPSALLPKLVRYFDEPFADSSAIPVYYVSELARRHVKVVLSGEGGDEVLAGYETYRARRSSPRCTRGCRARSARGSSRPSSGACRCRTRRSASTTRRSASSPVRYLPLADGHLWWKTILTEELKAGLYARGAGQARRAHRAALLAALRRVPTASSSTRLQYVDAHLYLPADILTKVDRMSMAHSLEARVPFLDRAMVELTATLPSAAAHARAAPRSTSCGRAMADRLPALGAAGEEARIQRADAGVAARRAARFHARRPGPARGCAGRVSSSRPPSIASSRSTWASAPITAGRSGRCSCSRCGTDEMLRGLPPVSQRLAGASA